MRINLRAIQVTALLGGALIFQGALPPRGHGAEVTAPAKASGFVPETPQQTASRLMAEQWLAVIRSWFKGGAQFVGNNSGRGAEAQPAEGAISISPPWTQRPLCGPIALAYHLVPQLPGAGARPNPEEWLRLYANNQQRARYGKILADIARVFEQRGMQAPAAHETAMRQVFSRWDLYEHLIKFGAPDPRHQQFRGPKNPYDPSAISSDATDFYNRGLLFQRIGNFTDAAVEYERATRSRHAMAQASLAYLYETGQGVQRNLMKALELYQLAAQQGHSVAQYNLGRIHQNGLKHLNQVIAPNPALAEQFLRRAAAQGVVAAYHQLGILYHTQGGRVNPAALNPEQIKIWDKNGDGKLTSAENRLFQDAHDHFLLAAQQGYGPSLHALGVMYQRGEGVKIDLARAAYWLEEAVKHEQPDSFYNLAQLYENGLGVPPNLPRAFILYREAARMGHAPSQYNLGVFYYQGRRAGEQVTLRVPVAFAAMHPAESLPAQLAKISAVLASARARYLPVPGNSETQRLELLVPVGQGLHAAAVLGKWYDSEQPGEMSEPTHEVLGGNDPVRAYAWWWLAARQRQQAAISSRDTLQRLLTPEQLRDARTLAAQLQARLTAPKAPSPMVDAQSSASFTARDWSTGFFVSKNGYVVTGKHLKLSGTRFQVVTENGAFPAQIVNLQHGDLDQYLLLKVSGNYQFPALSLSYSHGMRQRDAVQVLGNQFTFANQGLGPRAALADTHIQTILGAQADPRFFTLHNPALGDRLVFTFEAYLDKPRTPNAISPIGLPNGDTLYRLQTSSLKRLKAALHSAHHLLANADLSIGYLLKENMWYDSVKRSWHQLPKPQARKFAEGEWVVLDSRRVRTAPPLAQVEEGRALLRVSVIPGMMSRPQGAPIRLADLVTKTLVGPFDGLHSDLTALEKALGDARFKILRRTPGFRGAALLNNQGQAVGMFFPSYTGRTPDVFQNFSSYHKHVLKTDHLIAFLNRLPDVRYHTRPPALPKLVASEKLNFDSQAYLLAKARSAMVLVQVSGDKASPTAAKVATKGDARP
jgi:TPR repeat protein